MENKEPKIGAYIDDKEKAVIEAIEGGAYDDDKSILTDDRRLELQEIARNTINEERTKITIRVPNSDLASLKAKALREGIPYQTLINSILHKAAQ